jgi:hypothetical protein
MPAAKTRKKANKSQAIREYASKHPEATGAEIAQALKVRAGLVYAVLAKGKNKSKRAGGPSKPEANGFSLEGLVATKRLVDRVGLETARAALTVLERLR